MRPSKTVACRIRAAFHHSRFLRQHFFGNDAQREGIGLARSFFGGAPYTVTPGRRGNAAIQRPSVSRSSRIVSCICFILPLAMLTQL